MSTFSGRASASQTPLSRPTPSRQSPRRPRGRTGGRTARSASLPSSAAYSRPPCPQRHSTATSTGMRCPQARFERAELSAPNPDARRRGHQHLAPATPAHPWLTTISMESRPPHSGPSSLQRPSRPHGDAHIRGTLAHRRPPRPHFK